MSAPQQLETLNALAQLMGLPQQSDIDAAWREQIINGSLIRGWDNIDWDATAVPFHQPFTDADGTPCWRLGHKRLAVQSAGPDPRKALIRRRCIPHAITRVVCRWRCMAFPTHWASWGLDWDLIRQHLRPDQIAVYAGFGHGPAGCQWPWRYAAVVPARANAPALNNVRWG